MKVRGRVLSLAASTALILGGAGWVMAQDQRAPASTAEVPAASQPQASAPDSATPTNMTGDAAAVAAGAPPDEAAPPPQVVAQSPLAPEPPEAPVAAPSPPPAPLARPRFTTAVLQATDKVTAETLRFEAKVGESVRYKGLVITPRACEATAGDEPQADSWSYLEVTSQPAPVQGRPTPAPHEVFHGWMSAGSPSLNPLPSPGYDVWVIACRTAAPTAPAGHA